MRVLDVQGLAGAMTYGAVREGFDLVGVRALPGGFGRRSVEANKHLLGDFGSMEEGSADTWRHVNDVDFMVGCPPCSGFSGLNSSKGANARGSTAAINDCMKEYADFVAWQLPAVAAMESVQAAYKKGRDLMQELRRRASTGLADYRSVHLLVWNKELGNPQWGRRRYFHVLVRDDVGDVGFEALDPRRRPVTSREAIGDLVQLEDTMELQAKPVEPFTDYQRAARHRREGFITAHARYHTKPVDRLEAMWRYFEPGGSMSKEKYCELTGYVPKDFDRWWGPGERKLDPNGAIPTIGGWGGTGALHWVEERTLTARECARTMGLPDSWDFSEARNPAEAAMWTGKGVTVHAASYLARGVKLSLEGKPGALQGVEVGEHERLVEAR